MFEEYFFVKQRVINIFAQFHMRIAFSLKSIGYKNFNEQMMISGMYCAAMREVGADPGPVLDFVAQVGRDGVAAGLARDTVPQAAREFMRTTFAFIDANQPHCVAAALALGREQIIPEMFQALLERMGIGEDRAPTFHYYLKRHIELDGESHGPISLFMLEQLCEGDPSKLEQARIAAQQALEARLAFWDGVLEALPVRLALPA